MNPNTSWKVFRSEPHSFSQATISKYLRLLLDVGYIFKIEGVRYLISKNGRERLKELSKEF
jgi:predicted transcriptional regulator